MWKESREEILYTLYLEILGLMSHISSLPATMSLISGSPQAKERNRMKFRVMFSLCWPWVRLK